MKFKFSSKKFFYGVLTVLTIIGFVLANHAEVTESVPIWQALGIWTLLPPFLAIVLAFLTNNVIISLALGVFTGSMLVVLAKGSNNLIFALNDAFTSTIATIVSSMADKWNAGILLQVMAIGGLIALISAMGGTYAVAEKLASKAKTARSSQLITWVLGLFVFFDDYANSLIIGPIMRPVTDRQRISREKLAFIVDATAAPIAGIALVSTWIGYELSLIQNELPNLPFETSSYSMFLETIPYRFYNIFILVFVVLTIVMLREFGPMYKAEDRARKTGKLLADNATPLAVEENMNIKPEIKESSNIWNAIIPIATLIISSLITFYTNGYSSLAEADLELVKAAPLSIDAIRICYSNSDASVVLFFTSVLSGIVALSMGIFQQIFNLKEGIDIWVEGWKSMVITVVILLFAWSIADVIKNQLDADMYLATSLADSIPAFILPSIIFLLASVISFATGTSYGTMGILMPLAIPLANAVSLGDRALIVATTASVLTGAIFGDHCSPISDTTILSSMGTACDHIDHVKTQMLYAIVVAMISVFFGFIPAGLGISPIFTLPLGILAMIILLLFIGKKLDNRVEE